MTRIPGNHVCGLYYVFGATLERVYLPQVQLDSHTTINPVCFTTQLTQTFQNSGDKSLSQVRYTLPLYDGVAVNGYTIRYDSKVLKGVVKQKDDAKKTYQAAIDRGETAGLLESLPAGVFGVTLGNVPAKTDVVVEVTYCGELKHDAAIDGLRYMLPTSIAPRYGNYPGKILDSNTVAKSGINITVDVDMANSAIRKVQSPSHPIAISMGATSTTPSANAAPFQPSQASATLTLGKAELAEDFVLQLLIDDINKPQAILEVHPTLPNQRALMATLVPRFTLDPIYPEIVFIADQSGSMRGPKNTSLVSALKVFLKSLPLGVRFNICAFGNNFKFLWPKSQAYNEDNVNTALSFVGTLNADYGGTEILKPVTAAFEQRLQDLPLEVMLLTDGEIWGEDAVFSYINEQIRCTDARVFALGIGGDVSHTLVEGVARAGNGFAQFVTQNENADEKVLRMLKGALYAHTKDYELEVHYDEKDGDTMTDDDDFEIIEKVNECLVIKDKAAGASNDGRKSDNPKAMSFFDESIQVDKALQPGTESGTDRYAHLPPISTPKILQAPTTISPLSPFNRSTIYLMFGSDSVQDKVSSVTLRAKSAQGPLVLTIPVHDTGIAPVPTIHQLAARKAVQDLEEGRGWLSAAKAADGAMLKTKHGSRFDEIVEKECVRLGEKFQVAGKYTSFVAVENKDGEAKEIEVSQEGADVGGLEGRGFGGAQLMSFADSGKKRKTAGFSQVAFACAAPMAAASSRGLGGGGGAMRHRKISDTTAPFGSANVNALAYDLHSAPAGPVMRSSMAASFGAPPPPAPSGGLFGAAPLPPAPSGGGVFGRARSAATARISTGGAPPRKQLASMAARKSGPAFEQVDVDDEAGEDADSDKETTMRQLIDLQTFSGAWAWSDELFLALGIDKASVKINEFGGQNNPEVAATALAIAFLETKVNTWKASWEMVVTKARGWLASQVQGDVDATVRIATAFI